MEESLAIYNLLKEIFLILEDGERMLFAQYELTIPRFYTLKTVSQHPGISLTDLSVKMLIDKGNISRIVKGMVADGLLIRQPHHSDGRALCIFLSDDGEQLCQKAVAAHDRYNLVRLSILEGDTTLLKHKLMPIRNYLAENLENHLLPLE